MGTTETSLEDEEQKIRDRRGRREFRGTGSGNCGTDVVLSSKTNLAVTTRRMKGLEEAERERRSVPTHSDSGVKRGTFMSMKGLHTLEVAPRSLRVSQSGIYVRDFSGKRKHFIGTTTHIAISSDDTPWAVSGFNGSARRD